MTQGSTRQEYTNQKKLHLTAKTKHHKTEKVKNVLYDGSWSKRRISGCEEIQFFSGISCFCMSVLTGYLLFQIIFSEMLAQQRPWKTEAVSPIGVKGSYVYSLV